jgi:hypothetical protein
MSDLLFGASPALVRAELVALGERFGLVTPFTSLVAVDASRRVGDGAPFVIEQPVYAPAGAASAP